MFDTPLVPVNGPTLAAAAPMATPSADRAMLTSRLTALRTLAEATDGVAIVDSNNLKAGFQRIVDDLSSYYLLGYYSSGKLDGKFHSITVRVKRPGVQVRARRGYLAATVADATRASAGTSAATPAETAEARAIAAVVGPLDVYAREVPLRLQAAVGWKPGTPPTPAIWVVGELGQSSAGEEWRAGAEAEITVTAPDGATVATGRASTPAGARAFRTTLVPSAPLPPGEYTIRVGVRAAAGGSIPSRDAVHLAVPDAPNAAGAMISRRGQSTGNREVATADLRFRRNEQIRVEIPGARRRGRVGTPARSDREAARRFP